ncbi:D-cysteine desulfhydrase [Vibrio aerogenes CECT 7868]|uniref:D-cysteine desulfhydrase n=1 Tax=Vibrio aerogenes CECT 7868 TaxID=1216006 RepID=A0A1M5XTN1_9VIBR|nr:1-aminocyclopropane-1-carboxylate deaminase [Vibrio aerogenes]SHI03072.1 D-cysteine desulfhydrase [Vibrio aerogenes CECT 7868]
MTDKALIQSICDSPVTRHQFGRFQFFLKRDELLHPEFSGNKARKFMSLLTGNYRHIKTITSYGSPQANSLYSLAALAQIKGWRLEYYVDHIPEFMQQNPTGNYRAALGLGAKIIATNNEAHGFLRPEDYIHRYLPPRDDTLIIPEGGRCELARDGVSALAYELLAWIKENQIRSPVIALPSGTGTTALYLHQIMKMYHIPVITCACVGGKDYLIQQFLSLQADSYPTMLELPKKHHFGKLYQENYHIWMQLYHQTNVEFDLLYDPLMWRCLRQNEAEYSKMNLIYIHQGGIKGNESMLPRYQRKYPDIDKLAFNQSPALSPDT